MDNDIGCESEDNSSRPFVSSELKKCLKMYNLPLNNKSYINYTNGSKKYLPQH